MLLWRHYLNPHFQVFTPDGAFGEGTDGRLVFHHLPLPTDADPAVDESVEPGQGGEAGDDFQEDVEGTWFRWKAARSGTPVAVPSSRKERHMKVCIIGASGKLGRYMVRHALDRGHEVVGVCRAKSVPKLDELGDRITVVPGDTNERDVIRRAVAGCDGVLTVLVPWGVKGYASGTAQAVLDFAEPGARLVFSCPGARQKPTTCACEKSSSQES